MIGKLDEGVAEARRAHELDPLSVAINHVLSYNLYAARRYDEAIAQYHKTLEIDPSFASSRFGLANTYEQKGMFQEALVEWKRLMTETGEVKESAELEAAFKTSGWKGALGKRRAQLIEMSREAYVPPLLVARLCLKVGLRDDAFVWLEKAFEERRQRLGYLKVDPVYDSLHGDPRYLDLLQRIGLPQ